MTAPDRWHCRWPYGEVLAEVLELQLAVEDLAGSAAIDGADLVMSRALADIFAAGGVSVADVQRALLDGAEVALDHIPDPNEPPCRWSTARRMVDVARRVVAGGEAVAPGLAGRLDAARLDGMHSMVRQDAPIGLQLARTATTGLGSDSKLSLRRAAGSLLRTLAEGLNHDPEARGDAVCAVCDAITGSLARPRGGEAG